MTAHMRDDTRLQRHQPDGEPAALRPVAVVRLPVDGSDWADHLPPVPSGHRVSVSFTQSASWAHHGPVLRGLGYRVVDEVPAVDDDAECVDMVLYDDLPVSQPSWWRAVAVLAEQVLPLTFGPARLASARILAVHGRAAEMG